MIIIVLVLSFSTTKISLIAVEKIDEDPTVSILDKEDKK